MRTTRKHRFRYISLQGFRRVQLEGTTVRTSPPGFSRRGSRSRRLRTDCPPPAQTPGWHRFSEREATERRWLSALEAVPGGEGREHQRGTEAEPVLAGSALSRRNRVAAAPRHSKRVGRRGAAGTVKTCTNGPRCMGDGLPAGPARPGPRCGLGGSFPAVAARPRAARTRPRATRAAGQARRAGRPRAQPPRRAAWQLARPSRSSPSTSAPSPTSLQPAVAPISRTGRARSRPATCPRCTTSSAGYASTSTLRSSG